MELSDEQRELVVSHLKYAEKGAAAYRVRLRFFPHLDRDDLTSAAYLGLCAAATKFDPSRGVKFTTFSFYCIDASIKALFRKEKRANGWSYAPNKAEEAAGATGMQRLASRSAWPTVSNDEGSELIDFPMPVVYDYEMPPDERRRRRVFLLMGLSNMRDAAILSGRLDGETFEVIAKRLGITRQRVQQLEKRILASAKAHVAENWRRAS